MGAISYSAEDRSGYYIYITPNSNPPDAFLREGRLHLHLLPVAGLRQGDGPEKEGGSSCTYRTKPGSYLLHHYWVILVSHIELNHNVLFV